MFEGRTSELGEGSCTDTQLEIYRRRAIVVNGIRYTSDLRRGKRGLCDELVMDVSHRQRFKPAGAVAAGSRW
jgi:hypothetical protein